MNECTCNPRTPKCGPVKFKAEITMLQDQPGRGTPQALPVPHEPLPCQGLAYPSDLTQLPCSLNKRVIETPGDALEVVDALEWILCMEPEDCTPMWQRKRMAKGRLVVADIIHDLQEAARNG